VDLQITVRGGGTLTSGELSIDPADLGSGESYVALESGGSYTFKSGTGLSAIPEVTNYFGTVFRGINGVVLEATQNGDEFTVTSQTLPPQAASPAPADGATNLPPDVALTWSDTANTVSCNIYFGPSGNLTFQTNQTTTGFDPGTLLHLTEYNWRIDTVNASGTTTGQVWAFSTERSNDIPVFSSDPVTASDADQYQPYSGTLAGSATDADGDPIEYSLVSGPVWLGLATDGTLSGTPGIPDGGTNSWTVMVNDDHGGTNSATLSIFVIERGNHIPVFGLDPINASNAVQHVYYSQTLSGSATDADDDPLQYSFVDGPDWLSLATDGTLTGAPGYMHGGTNSWTVMVVDGFGGTNSAALNIVVSPPSTPLTWDEFYSKFQWGLHHTMRYEFDSSLASVDIYHDGSPDSPFIHYVKEMRTRNPRQMAYSRRGYDADQGSRRRRNPGGPLFGFRGQSHRIRELEKR